MYAHKLPVETEFFLFLLEHYAQHVDRRPADVLQDWDDAGVTATIRENYDIYHQEALTNAFADIDRLMAP